jgi:HEAT repeat protein
MADHRPNKGWLLLFGALLLLGLAYLGYGRWQHWQLAKALHNSDPVIRMDAVRKAAKSDYEDLLIDALHDDDPDIRIVAVWGFRGDGSEKTVRALLELFKDDNAHVRELALRKLRYLPAAARKFIYKGVEDEDPRIRAGAAYALIYIPRLGYAEMGSVDPPPRPPEERQIVVSLMTRLLKDDDVEVRKAASFCLFSYHLEAEEALRVLSSLEEAPKETDHDARDLADRLMRAAKQQSQ